MKLKHILHNTWSYYKFNWRSFLFFELLYKLFFTALFTGMTKGMITVLTSLPGIPVLTQENIFQYPQVYPVAFLLLLLGGYVSLIDITAVLYCLNGSSHGKHVTVLEMLVMGAKNATRMLRPKNWGILIFVLLLLPMAQIGVSGGLVTAIKIPGFIEEYIQANPILSAAASIALVIVIFLTIRWIFSIHTFLYEESGYGRALKRSRLLMKGKTLRIVLYLVIWNLMISVVVFLITTAACVLVCLVIYGLVSKERQLYLATVSVSSIIHLSDYTARILTTPLTFALLTALYQNRREAAGMGEILFEEDSFSGLDFLYRFKKVFFAAALLVFLGEVFIVARYDVIQYSADGSMLFQPGIAAHRGSSVHCPENTMPAYEQAIRENADWIEIDVGQTSDGVVVISHDDNLKRIAGVNKKIYNMTYDEIRQYDVGSWFSSEYSDLRILTLDELLQSMKGRIKVNIELKPTGHEKNFEENVIRIVRDNHFEDDCVLASLNRRSLRRIEELAPDLNTLYLMVFGEGNISGLEFADGFSIEESSITEKLVNKIHRQDKTVWAWTLNTEKSIENMQAAGVDYLLTDDPVMARAVISRNRLNEGVGLILNYFFPTPPPITTSMEEGAY